MILRKLVAVIGVIAVVVGIFQILMRERAEALTREALAGGLIYILAGVSLVIGVVLTLAGTRRVVRVPRLILLLGLLSAVSGLFVLAAPVFARDLADALYFHRAQTYRIFAAWTGGVTRIAFGALMVYAGLRPPTPRTPRLGSIVPLA